MKKQPKEVHFYEVIVDGKSLGGLCDLSKKDRKEIARLQGLMGVDLVTANEAALQKYFPEPEVVEG